MLEPYPPEATPQAAPRSRKLAAAVMTLGILPALLPLPLYVWYLQWLAPVIQAHRLQCPSFTCPAMHSWDSLGWLLVLGPEILVALASVLLGYSGLWRSRWHPISPGNLALLRASVTWGVVWTVLFGCMLLVGITAFAGTIL